MYPIAKIDNATLSEVIQATGFNLLSVLNDGIDPASLTTIRDNLPNSLVTTYTYKPLVGMLTTTDPSGYTMNYEYDAFNRLKRVRDADGHILSENTYHYKNQ